MFSFCNYYQVNEEAEKLGMNELEHGTPIVSKTCKKIVVKLLQYCLSMYGFLNLLNSVQPIAFRSFYIKHKKTSLISFHLGRNIFLVNKHEDNLILM